MYFVLAKVHLCTCVKSVSSTSPCLAPSNTNFRNIEYKYMTPRVMNRAPKGELSIK